MKILGFNENLILSVLLSLFLPRVMDNRKFFPCSVPSNSAHIQAQVPAIIVSYLREILEKPSSSIAVNGSKQNEKAPWANRRIEGWDVRWTFKLRVASGKAKEKLLFAQRKDEKKNEFSTSARNGGAKLFAWKAVSCRLIPSFFWNLLSIVLLEVCECLTSVAFHQPSEEQTSVSIQTWKISEKECLPGITASSRAAGPKTAWLLCCPLAPVPGWVWEQGRPRRISPYSLS